MCCGRGGNLDRTVVLQRRQCAPEQITESILERRQRAVIKVVMETARITQSRLAGRFEPIDIVLCPGGALSGVTDEVLDDGGIGQLLTKDRSNTDGQLVANPFFFQIVQGIEQRKICFAIASCTHSSPCGHMPAWRA